MPHQSLFYRLVGQTPVPMDRTDVEDALEWGGDQGNPDHQVALTRVLHCTVSTVFTGCNSALFGGPPQLFETMVFWHHGTGPSFQWRCATWAEAEAQHKAICAECWRPRYWLEFLRQTAMLTLSEAWVDLRLVLERPVDPFLTMMRQLQEAVDGHRME